MTSDGTPPDARPVRGRDRALVAFLLLGLGLLLGRAHVTNVDVPARAKKGALHAEVLANRAPDPYQYKLHTVTWAVEHLHRATGVDRFDLYAANVLLSLIVLLFAHQAWMRALVGPREALLGTFLLAGLAHGLFLDYYHHPYDLWGVAGFCLLARGLARGAGLASLAAGSLLLGVLWEKHALLPLVWLLLRRAEGSAWKDLLPRAALLGACALAVPVAVRLALGGDRALVDVTPLAEQDWLKIALQQGPYVLPFVAVLLATWRTQPRLVRLLWLYVPVMFVAYAASRFILYEVRSFWAFAPVFTATAAVWAAGLGRAAAPPGPTPVTPPLTPPG